jgi:hypothetical protein
VDITVDRVHLVNQYQHPDCGYYTWDVAEEVQFGCLAGVGLGPARRPDKIAAFPPSVSRCQGLVP